MAREFYELSGGTGDKESQEWIWKYLQAMVRTSSWFGRKSFQNQLEAWRRMIEAGDERLNKQDSK